MHYNTNTLARTPLQLSYRNVTLDENKNEVGNILLGKTVVACGIRKEIAGEICRRFNEYLWLKKENDESRMKK